MPPVAANPYILKLSQCKVPLDVKRSPRARRIALRLDNADGSVKLVLPRGVSLSAGIAFAETHEEWILASLTKLPARVRFRDGTSIPFLGKAHVIHAESGARTHVRRAGGEIRLSGDSAGMERRVREFLKSEARRIIGERAREKAARIGRAASSVTIRDTKSRWGSCSASGRLSFSWRLIMTPEAVLDYVIAHEVAHMVEMNHGPRFWRLVGTLTPAVSESRRWLARNGSHLFRYG